ncbi:centrosomal protein of 63 kDa isoform X5 [Apus apus]|uniref:centrosomal protein of 63 kDa isoform X5 n=1 Tax=Apus apus TaxID=8895 RepID=UPI0021F89009|nr:centrosomal protein of 63 kDa isoform X5 [Apus apus]
MEALLEGMQRNGQGGRGFLTSCEAELQELMKQIDIMVAHKKSEWEGQTQALEACLSAREQELSSVRAALQEKEKEVEDLEKAKQDMVREFEQQLRKFQEELSRLRRSYEKLQKKKLREARGDASKRQGEDEFEISCLTRKLESQLSGRRQMVESVELASQLEVQHLTSKLERASDALCASKLEVERLNVRVDSLTESSQMILEDQQRVQEELRQSKKMLEVLQDEKMELRATLQAQEDFIDRSKLHQEQLQKELARVTETLHRKELLIRALEERLQEKQVSSLGLEDGLLQLDVAQQKEQHLQPEVTHLEDSLVSLSCAQLGGELHERSQELQALEEHHPESKAEMEKLKEQLSQAEQTHSSELEEMKREISRLTQELQQRDITIASASGTTSDLEQRLRAEFERAEIERAERKAVEHRVLLVQLETLRLENRLLSEMLKKAECGMLEGKGVTLKALTEDYAAELNTLKSENQQLKKDLAEARAKVELAQQVCQDEGTAQQLQDKEPEARDVQYRVTREAQHKPDEQAERIPHTPDGTILHHQGEPQRWGAAETGAVTPATGELPTQSCRENCMESSALGAVLGVDSLLHVLDGNKDFAGEAPKQSILDEQRASVPLCLLPTASVGSIAARYLKEEELRSQHILECLNAHIEDLKKESEKIVREFGHQE